MEQEEGRKGEGLDYWEGCDGCILARSVCTGTEREDGGDTHFASSCCSLPARPLSSPSLQVVAV
jgi:hypothetical protein